MSLRKKIIISFIISAVIVGFLAIFVYVNFLSIRSEIRFLEVTDSIRNRTLELRRHEKNFFLFEENTTEEAEAMRGYIDQLYDITEDVQSRDAEKADALAGLLTSYEEQFNEVETGLAEATAELAALETMSSEYDTAAPLVKATIRDKPASVARFLQDQVVLPADHPLVVKLNELDTREESLRRTGEQLILIADDLNKDARANAESGINASQTVILVFVPLFLVIGLSLLLVISTSVVRRLKTLTSSVEQIGERFVPGTEVVREKGGRMDEVDILVEKTRRVNSQLMDWERELDDKNEQLIRSKKLAAIGTMASGVAHELNNPINNITISAQVLQKKIPADAPPEVREIVADIIGQTLRVKGIVSNLLEFAREREPRMSKVKLVELVGNAYSRVSRTMDTDGVDFSIDSEAEISIRADNDQLERVFINLFSNAVAVMEGNGKLTVKMEEEDGWAIIWVADNGGGLPQEDLEKIFDPFFTKKENGTGLGLAIVMNIISQHGGDISAVSEEDMGTVFEIRLPERID